MILESIRKRCSYYDLSKDLPVELSRVLDTIDEIFKLVPDAFNMKSQRGVVVTGDAHEKLWDSVHDVFSGKVAREKTDSFKSGAGTVLFFTDTATVAQMADQFPYYADKFPHWGAQSLGMAEFAIWCGLRDLGIGASLQHYNPVIDERVRQLFDVPETWALDAQLVFGAINTHPDPKPDEEIRQRVLRVS